MLQQFTWSFPAVPPVLPLIVIIGLLAAFRWARAFFVAIMALLELSLPTGNQTLPRVQRRQS